MELSLHLAGKVAVKDFETNVVALSWSQSVHSKTQRPCVTMSAPIKLIGTSLSHYSRKVRILLDLYELPYQFVDIGSYIAQVQLPAEVGNNPLLRVPVMQHGDDWLVESDHMSAYIVHRHDVKDRYKVNSMVVCDLNIKAMLNGVMSEEVKIIVARRLQVPTQEFGFFAKAQNAVDNGLTWLDGQHAKFDATKPTYKEFHLVCCWDHLAYYDFVLNMTEKYKHLHDIVTRVSENKVISQSAPHVVKPKEKATNAH